MIDGYAGGEELMPDVMTDAHPEWRRKCLVCDVVFELEDEEIVRHAKEGLGVPSRCPKCTARGERFSTLSLARRRHERAR